MIRNDLLEFLKSKYNTEKFDYVGIYNDEHKNEYIIFKINDQDLGFKVVDKNCFMIRTIKILSSNIYQKGFESKILKFNGKHTILYSYIGGTYLNEEVFEGRAFDFDLELITKRLEGWSKCSLEMILKKQSKRDLM